MKLTVSASGPADPDVVWDRYIHPARWHEWSPQIGSVDYPDDEISPGGSGTVHGPCGLPVHFEIIDIDPIHDVDGALRRWCWRVSLAGITLDMTHDVQPVPGAGVTTTRTTLEISGPAPIVMGYLPIARIALGRLVH